ncbi:hypothetical protein ACFL27_17025 [candidate division CSSED10-310 bacterium]|uniref:Uncharacterized protein n=1 Tax=candidate division CSSED10-310 bacterium TaxID=2855610 RepID=A0ABV6Z0D8_UNCC1
MGDLSEERKQFYTDIVNKTKLEYDEIGEQIEQELIAVKERIAKLNEDKAAALQVYSGACRRLGVENEFEAEEEEEEEE